MQHMKAVQNTQELITLTTYHNKCCFIFQTSSDGNTTVSILSLWPKMEHINLELVCRASNPLMKEMDKVDSMRLEINCKFFQQ